MVTAREALARVMVAGLGTLALLGGLALGSTGCVNCNCPADSIEPLQLGTFEVIESSGRPELIGGMIEVEAERVEISITDAEGNDWVIDYELESKF